MSRPTARPSRSKPTARTIVHSQMHPGEIVADRFVVEREVASGGMGTVHRAFDRVRETAVALKVMIGDEPSGAARFLREAELLSELDHPALVGYVAHGRTDGGPFLAMEWLDGEDLATRLLRSPLSVDAAVACARRVAQALATLHRRGLVHRDVKPSNVFLVDGDPARAKLLDLGVARRIRETKALTGTGIAIGTPYYMAPEQARALRDLDARVDVFALGAVLFEAASGRPPFSGNNLVEVLAKIVLEPSPSLRDVVRAAPPALEAIVARCLEKNREHRFEDGFALADALARVADDTRPLTMAQSAPRTLGLSERRVLTVLLIGRADPLAVTMAASASADASARVSDAIASLGATAERLVDGSTIVALSEPAVPIDQAGRAARIALSIRAAVPELPLAIATGRAELSGRAPIGEAVGRAAKALSAASGGAIRLDDEAASLLGARFEVDRDDRGAFLGGERTSVGAARRLLGRPTPFVGRDREISVLEGLFRDCVDEQRSRCALVTAPAGSGKSRLRDELLDRLRADEETLEVIVGVADVQRAGTPFGALSSALRQSAGAYDGEPADAQREKLHARVARSLEGDTLAHALPFLGEMCGIPFPDETSAALRAARRDPLLMSDHVRSAFEELLSAECARHPVLLVLDDLHWGDLPTLRVVDSALRALHDRSLFVLILARPEVHDVFPRLLHERELQEVRLGAMPKRACERLIRDALGERATDEVVAWIGDRAQGNAFFIEELIRAVAASTRDVPDTVLGVVQARLDALGTDAKRALRAASVFGETFWQRGVEALLAHDQGVDGALRDLVAQEVVAPVARPRFPNETELAFRHALIRDAAYAMLTDEDRALAHVRAVQWLEARGDREPVELAEHAERGGDRVAAASFWARAAEEALDVNDLASAVERAERGVTCGAEGVLLGRLRLTQTIAATWQGDHPTASGRSDAAVAALDPGSSLWFRAAAEGLASAGRLGDVEVLARRLDRILAAEATSDARDEQIIALSRAFVPASNAGLRETERAIERAHAIARGGGLGAIARAQFCEAQGLDASMRGDPERGERLLLEAIAAYAEGGAARDRCLTQSSLAWAYTVAGHLDRADVAIATALSMAAEMRIRQGHAWATHMRGMISMFRERHAEAEQQLSEAVAMFRAQKNARQEGWALAALARVRGALGDAARAEEEARRSSELLRTSPVFRHWAHAARARALLCLGRSGEALEEARAGVDSLTQLPWQLDRGVAYRALAEALLATGDEGGATAAIQTASTAIRATADAISDPTWCAAFLALPDNAWILSR